MGRQTKESKKKQIDAEHQAKSAAPKERGAQFNFAEETGTIQSIILSGIDRKAAHDRRGHKLTAEYIETLAAHSFLKNAKTVKCSYAANFSAVRFFTSPINLEEVKEIAKENTETTVEKAEEAVKEQKSKKKRIQSLVFFLINIVVIGGILTYQLLTQKNGSAGSGEVHPNFLFLFAALGCFILIMATEQLRFMNLTKKAIGIGRPHLSYKVAAAGRYYDLFTPFSIGGQPFQIFYLTKYGVPGGSAVSITMSKYIFWQISYFALASVVMFVALGTGISGVGGVAQAVFYTLSWVGYAVLALLMITVTIITLSRRIGVSIVVGCLKLFCKMFHRDYNKLFRKVMRTVTSWQMTMKKFRRNPITWIYNLFLSIVAQLAIWFIPFFVIVAFVGFDANLIWTVLVFTVITDMASSISPLPGGAGVAELSFTALFTANMIPGLTSINAFWALLIWRILTYYIYLAQGLGVISYDFFIGNKRLDKHKAKWMNPKIYIKRKHAPDDI